MIIGLMEKLIGRPLITVGFFVPESSEGLLNQRHGKRDVGVSFCMERF
jgi:hypothetical protein